MIGKSLSLKLETWDSMLAPSNNLSRICSVAVKCGKVYAKLRWAFK